MIKLFRYLKKYWWAVLLAPMFMILEVAMDMLITEQMQKMIDDGIQALNPDVVKSVGITMIGFVLIGVACGILSGVFANIASCKFANDLRKDLFNKIMQLSYDQTDDFSTASLITRVSNDVTQIQTFIAQMIRMFIRSFGMFALGIIFTIRIDIRFANILLIVLPIEILIMVMFMKKTFPIFDQIQTRLDNVNTVVHENLTAARVVKAFSKEDYENNRFSKSNNAYADVLLKVNKIFALAIPLFMFFVYLAQIAIYAIGGSNILDAFLNNHGKPSIMIGQVTQATTYIVMICMSLIQLGMMFTSVARANASAKRINAVLDCKLDIVDGNMNANDVKETGSVEFKNVSFSYPKSSGYVLENINLKINKGETIAIVGATGSGKTTLVNLITRFYDVTEGEVLVDGVNVKEYKLHDLRNKVAIALQKAELFAGSIKENIKWGNENASDEQVIEAAQIAQAEEFILSKKDTYDEYIEEKGTSLSGGQKQRLSIARAIIKKPEILIFDDATSALDLITEAKLYKAMNEKIKETTKIVVAQRVATAKNADKIVVLDGGSIIAFDTHENLLANCEIYQDIYNSQLKKEGE
ncbi:MAG: ABC transporter ATP-binding protein/permease [Erysipelotrichaceae bacterium]|nr:ABC transporter ATP-binding protein/permease [Erysipelotrichaceae bacterium]